MTTATDQTSPSLEVIIIDSKAERQKVVADIVKRTDPNVFLYASWQAARPRVTAPSTPNNKRVLIAHINDLKNVSDDDGKSVAAAPDTRLIVYTGGFPPQNWKREQNFGAKLIQRSVEAAFGSPTIEEWDSIRLWALGGSEEPALLRPPGTHGALSLVRQLLLEQLALRPDGPQGLSIAASKFAGPSESERHERLGRLLAAVGEYPEIFERHPDAAWLHFAQANDFRADRDLIARFLWDLDQELVTASQSTPAVDKSLLGLTDYWHNVASRGSARPPVLTSSAVAELLWSVETHLEAIDAYRAAFNETSG